MVKHTILYLIIISLLPACNTGTPDQLATAPEKDTSTIIPADTAVTLAPATLTSVLSLDTVVTLSGFWVVESYINDLQQTSSPRKAQPEDISCISIPERTLQVTRMVFGFHDGGPDLLVVKNGPEYQLLERESKDIAWTIRPLSRNRIQIGDKIFRRLASAKTPDPENITVVEEILFSGLYKTEAGDTVRFHADGSISGWSAFTYYSVIFDYSEPAMDVDQVYFGQSNNNKEPYGFIFNGNTLLLYTLKCTEWDSAHKSCEVVDFGEIKHTLTRLTAAPSQGRL